MVDQQLFQFAYIPKYEEAINALASIADPEDWDFSDARVKKMLFSKITSNILSGKSKTRTRLLILPKINLLVSILAL